MLTPAQGWAPPPARAAPAVPERWRLGTRTSHSPELGTSPGGSPLCCVTRRMSSAPLRLHFCASRKLISHGCWEDKVGRVRSAIKYLPSISHLPGTGDAVPHKTGMDPALLGLTIQGGRTDRKPQHRQPFTAVTGAGRRSGVRVQVSKGGLACPA